MLLGVCYYPEQWPQHQWESDARRMAELGIRRVRIAEFAWSFGSRRHYDISSSVYREYCARIVEQMVRRYGQHPAVVAWQTDNELGCHDTVPTYTEAARVRFTQWLEQKYRAIGELNDAWG